MSERLDDLRTLARRLSDTENATGFIPDAEVTTYINHGIRRLRDRLVDHGGEPWFRKSGTVNTVANQATVSYPSDFRKMIGISVTLSGNDVSLEPLDFMQRDRFDDVNGWDNIGPIFYSLEQDNIRLYPTPDSVQTLTIHYLADFTALVNDADTIEAYGYEDYAAYYAAVMIRLKEDVDPSALIVERDRILQDAIMHLSSRDHGHPEPAVRDVRAMRTDRLWRFG